MPESSFENASITFKNLFILLFLSVLLIMLCGSIVMQCCLAAIVISAVMGLVSISVLISGFLSGC